MSTDKHTVVRVFDGPGHAEQARAARTTLMGHGGQEIPATGRGR